MNEKPNKSEVLGLQWRTAGGSIAYAYGKEVRPDGEVMLHAVTFSESRREWCGESSITPGFARVKQISVDTPEPEKLDLAIEKAVAEFAAKNITLC